MAKSNDKGMWVLTLLQLPLVSYAITILNCIWALLLVVGLRRRGYLQVYLLKSNKQINKLSINQSINVFSLSKKLSTLHMTWFTIHKNKYYVSWWHMLKVVYSQFVLHWKFWNNKGAWALTQTLVQNSKTIGLLVACWAYGGYMAQNLLSHAHVQQKSWACTCPN